MMKLNKNKNITSWIYNICRYKWLFLYINSALLNWRTDYRSKLTRIYNILRHLTTCNHLSRNVTSLHMKIISIISRVININNWNNLSVLYNLGMYIWRVYIRLDCRLIIQRILSKIIGVTGNMLLRWYHISLWRNERLKVQNLILILIQHLINVAWMFSIIRIYSNHITYNIR